MHTKAATRAAPHGEWTLPRRPPLAEPQAEPRGEPGRYQAGAAASARPGGAGGAPRAGGARWGRGGSGAGDGAGTGAGADPTREDGARSPRPSRGKCCGDGGGEAGPSSGSPGPCRQHPSGLPFRGARRADLDPPGGARGAAAGPWDGGTGSIQRARVGSGGAAGSSCGAPGTFVKMCPEA